MRACPSPLVGGAGQKVAESGRADGFRRTVIAWIPTASHAVLTNSTKGKPMATKKATNPLEPKAHGNWCVLSGSKKDGDAVYGARIWAGQTVKSGDIVALTNWKGHTTLVLVGEKVKDVAADLAKGTMASTIYTIQS